MPVRRCERWAHDIGAGRCLDRPALVMASRLIATGERGRPVDLPALPRVGGERLLPAGVRGVHIGPAVAHPDRRTLPGVVALEGADVAVEPTDDRLVEPAPGGARRPPDPPDLLL